MERSQVIAGAALALRSAHLGERAGVLTPAGQWIEQTCSQLGIEIAPCSRRDAALGGAHASLLLLDWRKPDDGGTIYVADTLDPPQRAFAIAHELGHLTLHRGEAVPTHASCADAEVDEHARAGDGDAFYERVEEYTPRARREFEANSFAAELLAPRALVRALFAAGSGSVEELAACAGISPLLAAQRRLDAVLTSATPEQLHLTVTPTHASEKLACSSLLATLNPAQLEAATAAAPALVLAGPGTGKTATLIGRIAYLLQDAAIQSEQVLALTFSNESAGEMRERLLALGSAGERVPVLTIHAFAATLLRSYCAQVPHGPDEPPLDATFRILDDADQLLLLQDLADTLGLQHYRSFRHPAWELRRLIHSFSRAHDELHTPEDYAALVATMRPPPPEDVAAPTLHGAQPPAFTASQCARAAERAHAYAIWTRELRRRNLLDYGSLISLAVCLLRACPTVLAEVRSKYPHILVDEYQDTNYAAGELLLLLAGTDGAPLWVVGDPNQSVYRWRGASPQNLPRLAARYPHLHIRTLRDCYRSVPALVEMASTLATRLQVGAETPAEAPLAGAPPEHVPEALARIHQAVATVAVRAATGSPALYSESRFASAADEGEGIARQIRRFAERGYALHEQAILCRTHKQAEQIRTSLAAAGIPVAEAHGFFRRHEIRVALAFVALAAGPGPDGLLCARELLPDMPTLGDHEYAEIVHLIAALAQTHELVPRALTTPKRLDSSLAVLGANSPELFAALHALGKEAATLRYERTIGRGLADFLMKPDGLAAHLLAVADGRKRMFTFAAATRWLDSISPAAARAALGALGELVALAARFDRRWQDEPEFKQRLLRATRHIADEDVADADPANAGRSFSWQEDGRPQSDAGGVPMQADVATSEEQYRGTVSTALPDEVGRRPRCFLHYLRALVASDVELPVSSGEVDAVRVLTLHKSKGLEFPVVFLPTLAQGQFPARSRKVMDPEPPGFRRGNPQQEDVAEERNLFYVGVTRARDVLVLTSAQQYGKSGRTTPSSLLDLLTDTPLYSHAEPLLANGSASPLPTQGKPARPRRAIQLEVRAAQVYSGGEALPVYDFAALDTYIACPRRFRYARQYGLPDTAGRDLQTYYRCLHAAMHDLHALRSVAGRVPWDDASRVIGRRWHRDGPRGSALAASFHSRYVAALQRMWECHDDTGPALALQPAAAAQDLLVTLRSCRVRVRVDRVRTVTDPAGSSRTDLIRLHTGRPVGSHQKDLELVLYALGYMQQHPEANVSILLAYVGGGLAATATDDSAEMEDDADDEAVSASALFPQDVVNVTREVTKCANTYMRLDRRGTNRLDKLDEAAEGIAAERFEAIAYAEACQQCPYTLLCPAEPLTGVSLPILRRESQRTSAPVATTPTLAACVEGACMPSTEHNRKGWHIV